MDKPVNIVLELLYDRGGKFYPFQELAGDSGLSTGRLENALELLRHRGQQIEKSPFGLRLVSPVKLDAHLVERNLDTARVGKNVICFAEVGSTNDVAFDSARQKGADGLVVLADSQKKGRGRHGRKWISPPGANILMSALLIDSKRQFDHEVLTIAAGLAVAEGIEQACKVRCDLKWPNDVLLDGAKLCGVLVEIRTINADRCIVIGAGVNVNAAPSAKELQMPVICLAEHLGGPVERLPVVRAIIQRLDRWMTQVQQHNLKKLHKLWLVRCQMLNQRLTVICAGRRHTGRVLDIDPLKGLVLQCDNGRLVQLKARTSTIVQAGIEQ